MSKLIDKWHRLLKGIATVNLQSNEKNMLELALTDLQNIARIYLAEYEEEKKKLHV